MKACNPELIFAVDNSLPAKARAYRAFVAFSILPRLQVRIKARPGPTLPAGQLCVLPSSAYTCFPKYRPRKRSRGQDHADQSVTRIQRQLGLACLNRLQNEEEINLVHNPFMARAIQLSLENVRSGGGGPFGCLVVKEATVIAEGVNQGTAT